jgi:hypothetical protein
MDHLLDPAIKEAATELSRRMMICAPHDGKVDLPLKGGFVARAGTPYQEMPMLRFAPAFALWRKGRSKSCWARISIHATLPYVSRDLSAYPSRSTGNKPYFSHAISSLL